jgi:hypothetical protein
VNVRRLLLWSCLLAIVAGAVEGVAALATWMLWRRGHMPRILHLDDAEVLRLLRTQSQRFGWLPPLNRPRGGFVVQARPDPAFAEDVPPCASTYGDSFTFGTPVGDDATFPHDLAVALGCRVANFGMPGYGSDQAFLLYRAQRDVDRAPIVILGHLTENVLRNVNQYRELLYPGGDFGFKPRLHLDAAGKLRRVPVPVRSLAGYRAMEASPERKLPWDAFTSRPRRAFPYTPKLAAWLASDFMVREKLFDEPWHLPYYAPDHPSQALQVTTAILEAFVRDAARRGRRPLVVVIPTALDLIHARRTGRWAAAPLVSALVAARVPVVDVGPALDRRLGARDPTTLYDGGRYGHLTPEGYRWLAESVRDAIGPRAP